MDLGQEKILQRRSIEINPATGEILQTEEEVRLRREKREKFVFLYIEQFEELSGLRKKTFELLAFILCEKVIVSTNQLSLDSVFRMEAAAKLRTSKDAINNSVSELVKKILLEEKECRVAISIF